MKPYNLTIVKEQAKIYIPFAFRNTQKKIKFYIDLSAGNKLIIKVNIYTNCKAPLKKFTYLFHLHMSKKNKF